MIKVIIAVPYLLIYSKLCFVNTQHSDGTIKLKQGNVIGVRKSFRFSPYFDGKTKTNNIYLVTLDFKDYLTIFLVENLS